MDYLTKNDKDDIIRVKNKIKSAIDFFLIESHSGLDDVFQKIKAASDSLNKSIADDITSLETFYLNDTYQDFGTKISLAEAILENYYWNNYLYHKGTLIVTWMQK